MEDGSYATRDQLPLKKAKARMWSSYTVQARKDFLFFPLAILDRETRTDEMGHSVMLVPRFLVVRSSVGVVSTPPGSHGIARGPLVVQQHAVHLWCGQTGSMHAMEMWIWRSRAV